MSDAPKGWEGFFVGENPGLLLSKAKLLRQKIISPWYLSLSNWIFFEIAPPSKYNAAYLYPIWKKICHSLPPSKDPLCARVRVSLLLSCINNSRSSSSSSSTFAPLQIFA